MLSATVVSGVVVVAVVVVVVVAIKGIPGDASKYSPPTTREPQAKARPNSSITPTHLQRQTERERTNKRATNEGGKKEEWGRGTGRKHEEGMTK